jgi:LytR cell envelope-related transcriptional attenuator
MGRGIVLLAVAFLIGIVLLQKVDAPARDEQVTAGSDDEATTTTTALPAAATTTTAALRQPKDVRVLTANGTSVKGAGARIKDKLLAAGYNALAATDTKAPASASAVYFTAGFDREAAAIAQVAGLPAAAVQAMPVDVPVADLKAANVLVVVGPEIAVAGPSSSSTSTTVKKATSSTSSTTTTKKP